MNCCGEGWKGLRQPGGRCKQAGGTSKGASAERSGRGGWGGGPARRQSAMKGAQRAGPARPGWAEQGWRASEYSETRPAQHQAKKLKRPMEDREGVGTRAKQGGKGGCLPQRAGALGRQAVRHATGTLGGGRSWVRCVGAQ